LGIKLDEKANKVYCEEKVVSSPDSTVQVIVIPTNEELMIAKETYEIVGK
jgi:acetate kinase